MYRDNDFLPPNSTRFKLTRQHVTRMNIGKYANASFSHLQESPEKEQIRNYLRNLRTAIINGYGLYLHGNFGSGKTYTSAAILKQAAMRGYSCYLVQAADLPKLRIDDREFDSEQTVWQRLLSVHLLVIDDLGKEHNPSSGWSTTVISNLLRDRNAAKNSATIVTSNISFKPTDNRSQFASRYGRDTHDLCKDMFVPVHLTTSVSARQSRLDSFSKLIRG